MKRFAVMGDLRWGFAVDANEIRLPLFLVLQAAAFDVEVVAYAAPHTVLVDSFSIVATIFLVGHAEGRLSIVTSHNIHFLVYKRIHVEMENLC